MCREKRKLPIGIENFEQIIKDEKIEIDGGSWMTFYEQMVSHFLLCWKKTRP